MIFTELETVESEKPRHGACRLLAVPGNFEKAAMSGLQVCDGDNGEKLTSHFPSGLLSFGSLQLRMNHKAAHTLYLYGLGAPGRLQQPPVALWCPC